MDFMAAIDHLSQRVEQTHGGAQPEDYEVDGVLYCGRCNTPRQTIIDLTQMFPLNGLRKVNCLCKCRAEALQEEEEQRKRIELLRDIERNKRASFPESDMESWTFDKDDGTDPRTIKAMRGYVEHFAEFKAKGKGLLLYGPCGTGKTFAAACVANALLDKGYTCLMTNFHRIVSKVSGMRDDKLDFLDSFNRYDLLILDDLGAERDTEYMAEMVYNIIDARYRAGFPMIITTNLTSEKLKQPNNISEQRIYSRLFERCHPIQVEGADRRRKSMKNDFADTQKLLGL